jgi:hypothetical protein
MEFLGMVVKFLGTLDFVTHISGTIDLTDEAKLDYRVRTIQALVERTIVDGRGMVFEMRDSLKNFSV